MEHAAEQRDVVLQVRRGRAGGLGAVVEEAEGHGGGGVGVGAASVGAASSAAASILAGSSCLRVGSSASTFASDESILYSR